LGSTPNVRDDVETYAKYRYWILFRLDAPGKATSPNKKPIPRYGNEPSYTEGL